MYRYHILHSLTLLPLTKNFSKNKGGKTMFINYKKCNLKLCKKAKKKTYWHFNWGRGRTMQRARLCKTRYFKWMTSNLKKWRCKAKWWLFQKMANINQINVIKEWAINRHLWNLNYLEKNSKPVSIFFFLFWIEKNFKTG